MTQTYEALLAARRAKLDELRALGDAYPNGFKQTITIARFTENFGSASKEELETWSATATPLCVAGRIKLQRLMGKLSFAHIGDEDGMLQLLVTQEKNGVGLPPEEYAAFKKMDLGDIIGVEGLPCKTKKGELSIRVSKIHLLAKGLIPLPDKHHGLADRETKSRQRYLDLMVNPSSIETFKARSLAISALRSFMEHNDFIEVETPMMHPIPGGATARPFITHHNTLDMDLYLRIAPELYLKRLIVGGFKKVFEVNRNFRNEGLSPRHNPEFTMMEFYWAYADFNDLMVLLEDLLFTVSSTLGSPITPGSFKRMTMAEAVTKYALKGDSSVLATYESLKDWWEASFIEDNALQMPATLGESIAVLFEEFAEHHLEEPTFITEFPIEISPLARRNSENPNIADRFELFIGGQEIANGFSELNDPDDQEMRFRNQVAAREGGDDEAMYFDEDYIEALRYGMPPTAGAGIGIDRLVALILGKDNIRDVILFPQMRPQNSK